MNELDIWNSINKTKTVEELKECIINIWGENGIINGRSEPFMVKEMNLIIDRFVEDFNKVVLNKQTNFNSLPTRQFGIRQQLCMILLNPTK